jgi:hypothetical protein
MKVAAVFTAIGARMRLRRNRNISPLLIPEARRSEARMRENHSSISSTGWPSSSASARGFRRRDVDRVEQHILHEKRRVRDEETGS